MVFEVALTVIVAFPLPDAVLVVNHDALSAIVQLQLEEMVKVEDEALLPKEREAGLVFR